VVSFTPESDYYETVEDENGYMGSVAIPANGRGFVAIRQIGRGGPVQWRGWFTTQNEARAALCGAA